MKLKADATSEKLAGAYYTPIKLARFMTKYFEDQTINSLLEPSCGEGVFLNEVVKSSSLGLSMEKITAIEIDVVGEQVKNRFPEANVIVDDFFELYKNQLKDSKFDLILGNPPYIRYQYLSAEQRSILSEILVKNGMKSNRLINAWVAFVVACTDMLSDKGRLAFVLPAELLQVVYAEELRLFLSEKYSEITLITFSKLVFDEIEQEIVVFIGEKKPDKKNNKIRVVEVRDLGELDTLDISKVEYQEIEHVKEKWTRYFLTRKENMLINSIYADDRFVKIKDIALVNVGITTGNNKFFSVTEDVAKAYDLHTFLVPLLGRSIQATGITFRERDFLKNVKLNRNAQLLVLPETELDNVPEGVRNYILSGEKRKENKGYKCSIRKYWYSIPSVWVPDAFFLRRNHQYPKMILNCYDAVSTDTMHRIKFKEGIPKKASILSYYNSISLALAELCGRSYGGGVLEILPREVGNILLPDISIVSDEVTEIFFDDVDNMIRSGISIESVMDKVDHRILIEELGLSQEDCKVYRGIWNKLRKRRLSRP